MNSKRVVIVLVVAVALIVAFYATRSILLRDQAIEANNTSAFQWTKGPADFVVALNVSRETRLGLVETPPVPRSGRILVVGHPGAVKPGGGVQLQDMTSGKTFGAQADGRGAFNLPIDAEQGDRLTFVSFPPMRVQNAPASAIQMER